MERDHGVIFLFELHPAYFAKNAIYSGGLLMVLFRERGFERKVPVYMEEGEGGGGEGDKYALNIILEPPQSTTTLHSILAAWVLTNTKKQHSHKYICTYMDISLQHS